jgi:hypothetical protein
MYGETIWTKRPRAELKILGEERRLNGVEKGDARATGSESGKSTK